MPELRTELPHSALKLEAWMFVQPPTELAALAGLQAEVRGAHEGMIYCLGWHPAGHVIATGSGDCSTKFWCRARPGDPWKDSLQRDQEQHAGSVGEAGVEQPVVCAALQLSAG